MKYTVCAVTGSRAEFGILLPLLLRLNDCPEIEFRLAVTGSHLSTAYGHTLDEIRRTGLPIHAKIPLPLGEGDDKAHMIQAAGAAMSAFADYFSAHRPDLLVVLGDRYEIFAVSAAAAMLGIPIAHLHGGETTEGAVDEFLRHSITKMSYLHFVSCEAYRRRVIQLGEAPERVFNVGALSTENCLRTPLLSVEELSESLQFDLTAGPYSVVTFHPVTLEDNTAERQLHELIAAMDAFPAMSYIVTLANADAGGRAINAIWQAEGASRKNWLVVPSLGMRRYLSALKGGNDAGHPLQRYYGGSRHAHPHGQHRRPPEGADARRKRHRLPAGAGGGHSGYEKGHDPGIQGHRRQYRLPLWRRPHLGEDLIGAAALSPQRPS